MRLDVHTHTHTHTHTRTHARTYVQTQNEVSVHDAANNEAKETLIPEDSDNETVLHLDEDDDEQSDPMCVEDEQGEIDEVDESADVARDNTNETKLPDVPLHA